MKRIYFNNEEVKQCIEFAYFMKEKHPHFKDKNNKAKRTEKEIIRDVVQGKLAEIALNKYLKEKHKDKNPIISDVDFNIYPEYIGDSYDLLFNDIVISVKSSKMFSSCLLIEKERFVFNKDGQVIGVDGKTNNLPDYYVFVKVNVDFDNNIYFADICGGISHNDFMNIKREAPRGMILNKANAYDFFLLKKTAIYEGKGVPLLATNYGIHLNQLKEF